MRRTLLVVLVLVAMIAVAYGGYSQIEPLPIPVPEEPVVVPEEPVYVAVEDYTAEDWLDLEDRYLHQRMEAQCSEMAAHIRDTRTTWKRLEASGIKLTEEQKLAMVDEGNPIRVSVKAELSAAPADLRTWDGKEIPEDLRKVKEVTSVEAARIP